MTTENVTITGKDKKLTCWQCEHVDQFNGICGLFKIVPPMRVICDPVQYCRDFDYIPF